MKIVTKLGVNRYFSKVFGTRLGGGTMGFAVRAIYSQSESNAFAEDN